MKTKKTELDVDFIGGQCGLTQAEEKALSNFFKQRKSASISSKVKHRRNTFKLEKAFT